MRMKLHYPRRWKEEENYNKKVARLRRKKIKKVMDQQLLSEIYYLKQDWMKLKKIIDHSIEPTEEGLRDLALVQAKYFYLLREARHRKLNALS